MDASYPQASVKKLKEMLRNYFLIAVRSINKQRFYSFINISGLSIGIACCLLIMLYVTDELSYDRYHEHANQTYRMAFDGQLGENPIVIAQVGAPAAHALVNDFPEVAWATRFRDRGSFIVQAGENVFKEEEVLYADSNIFRTFDFELIQGSPINALAQPNSVVITERMAEKYFGSEDPIGQLLTLDGEDECKVTGVMKSIPTNTHFTVDILVSMETLEESKQMDQWMSMNFQTYFVLKPGTNPETLEPKMRTLVEKYIGPLVDQYMGISLAEFEEAGNRVGFFFDPMTDIHLRSGLEGELNVQSNIKYIYIFSAIAFFILLIACINFMNLSTAKSAGRAREVGVRKAMGSDRGQLIYQFLNESTVLSLISFLFAILLAQIALPSFNTLASKELYIPFTSPSFYFIMIGGVLFVGVLAGSYPAFFLSAFNAASILKGGLSVGMKSGTLRSVLVTFQFTASIVLVAGTMVIYNQLQYIQNKKLGFDRNQVLILDDTYVLENDIQAFKNTLLQYPEVEKATISGFLPVSGSNNNTNGYFPKHIGQEHVRVINTFNVDPDYIPTMGIELIEGRNFDPASVTDSTAIIVNEAALEVMEVDGDRPLEGVFSAFTGDPDVNEEYRIIGVVKNFHFRSLRESISPMLFHLRRSTSSISLRLNTTDIPGLISKVENEWDRISAGQPFSYSFLDEKFNEMYRKEQRTGKIAVVFAFLAIFVACLGLFGLAAFTAEQKTKEIGIRKVLGASIANIVVLLSKEFSKLIILAILISVPIAWYFMDLWLSDFSYRIELKPLIFLGAGVLALIIAWVTMGYQSIIAARANPAESLKDE